VPFFTNLKQPLKNHIVFFIILGVIILLDTLVIIFKPELPGAPALSTTFYVFGLSLQAIVFIYTIAGFLLYRWKFTGKSNVSTLSWSVAFLLYGIVFIGMLLESLGVPWANSKDPIIFFGFRQFMILWVALMYYGISTILTDNKRVRLVPALVMLGFGYMWFAIGLLAMADIVLTMYVFLYTLWTPLCATISYSFLLYGRQAKLVSPRILTWGFAGVGISYLAWAPWHFTSVLYIYYVWFFIFDIGLSFIMLGYVVLPFEMRVKEKTESYH
jgi:hypothetical protein